MDDYNNELYHYGVKGMKWGVRRYQNKDGSLTPKGKKRYSDKSNNNSSSANKLINNMKNKKVSSLSSAGSGEEIAIYAVTLAAYLGTLYGLGKYATHKDRKRAKNELEEYYNNREIKDFKSAPKLRRKESPADSMKKTNPGYPTEPGSTMNCTFCTTAMAMREKGYDVIANKTPKGFYTDDLFVKAFNAKEIKPKKNNRESLMKELSSNGEGSYGNLTVYWKLGGGHSIFWKNDNGKVRIYDGQSGEEYTKDFATEKMFFNNIYISNSTYNRLDNVEPTEYALGLLKRRES